MGALGVQAGWGALGSGALRRAGFWWVLVSSGEFWWGAFSPLEPIRTYQNLSVFLRSVRAVRALCAFRAFRSLRSLRSPVHSVHFVRPVG